MLLVRFVSKESCNSAKTKMAGLQVSVQRKLPLWSASLGTVLLGEPCLIFRKSGQKRTQVLRDKRMETAELFPEGKMVRLLRILHVLFVG